MPMQPICWQRKALSTTTMLRCIGAGRTTTASPQNPYAGLRPTPTGRFCYAKTHQPAWFHVRMCRHAPCRPKHAQKAKNPCGLGFPRCGVWHLSVLESQGHRGLGGFCIRPQRLMHPIIHTSQLLVHLRRKFSVRPSYRSSVPCARSLLVSRLSIPCSPVWPCAHCCITGVLVALPPPPCHIVKSWPT